MANEKHLAILKQGMDVWNEWRRGNQATLIGNVKADLSVDLSGVNLSETSLTGANLRKADLHQANLTGAFLVEADCMGANMVGANLFAANLNRACLSGADLSNADLHVANITEAEIIATKLVHANLREAFLIGSNLQSANLSEADLQEANLERANLQRANFRYANLAQANLTNAILVETDFSGANLAGCCVYGIAAWNLKLEDAIQSGFVISHSDEPVITVDNLEVAQFIYLLLNNEKVRDVINTITTKVVLILGRFTPERKVVLDAIRNELRKHNYSPVLFDFDKPATRDTTETISTLAHLSRFIIAEITDPRSIPQELQTIVPNLPSVPIQPLLLSSRREYGMFEHFTRYPWVLPVQRYDQVDDLLASLGDKVIAPAEAKAKELQTR